MKKFTAAAYCILREIRQGTLMYCADILTFEKFGNLVSLKNIMLRFAGLGLKNPVFIDRGFRCMHPHNISIDEYVSLGHDNHLWAFSPIKIGKYTQTAKDLLIIAGSHEVDSYRSLTNQDVSIGDGCWIGARVTILGGVTIGKGCVIGACSLVKNNIPDWSVAVGVPARVIKTRVPAQEIVNPFKNYSPQDLD
jgi:acetyltransferase-like isoleucine patch superfamily enzyme